MKNYLLKIQYIGSNFYGFQKQVGIQTVQGTLEEALELVLRKTVHTFGSARTDRGVNALNQYVNFYFDGELDTRHIFRKLNAILFKTGITLKEIKEVDIAFHSRKSSKGKLYAYSISDDKEKSLFLRPYVYVYSESLDLELMKVALQGLKGRHDFTLFANIDRTLKNRNNICEIFDAGIIQKPPLTILYFYGDRFLYHMVRRMVYYVLKGAQGHIPEEKMKNPFSFPDLPYTRQVLPPEPLFLVDVIY
ncbi:MAG: tRNA pseudouridine(38-40) synthase TruA [Caldisericaceae bacterium]